MPIQELPPSTVRVIGASQIITDAASVVKELVDNALDANAHSIFVEIAHDAVEVIQVRDNGHGIAPEDRPLVCKAHCTSKITRFSDIKGVGGRSLGFRGVALAHAAELCGSFTVTTRVEGEGAAVSLKFTKEGSIEREECASHAFGTTVRLTDLFKNIPVRRQTALKKTSETLVKIKRMMQAYAFARPKVRVSLRILKAKDQRGQWDYVPRAFGAMLDTVREIVGKDCAGVCSYSELETEGYLVQTVFPDAHADVCKINNLGQFLSVDYRPVSSTNGVLKKILQNCKETLKMNITNGELKNPFMWMNIVCPPQSYDPNVEPAKDDLIFEDKDKLIAAVFSLLNSRYHVPCQQSEFMEEGLVDKNLLAHLRGDEQNFISLDQNLKSTGIRMYDDGDETVPVLVDSDKGLKTQNSEIEEDSQSGLNDPNVSNPWIIAKLHAFTRKKYAANTSDVRTSAPSSSRTASEANATSKSQPLVFSQERSRNTHSSASAEPNATENFQAVVQAVARTELNIPYESSQCSRGRSEALLNQHEAAWSNSDRQKSRQSRKFSSQTSNLSNTNEGTTVRGSDDVQTTIFTNTAELRTDRQALKQVGPQAMNLPRRPRQPRNQKPFISPVTGEARNWFRNLPKETSPSKCGESGQRPRIRPEIDLREAFLNVPRATQIHNHEEFHAETRTMGNNTLVQEPLNSRCEQTRPTSIMGSTVLDIDRPGLGATQGSRPTQDVILPMSMEGLADHAEHSTRLRIALFEHPSEDVHEPIWGVSFSSLPPSSSSMLRPTIGAAEIDEWTDRVMCLFSRTGTRAGRGADAWVRLRKVDTNIAGALSAHVTKYAGCHTVLGQMRSAH